MLKKEVNRIKLSVDKPYHYKIFNVTPGQYMLRVVHKSESVFKKDKSLFLTFDINNIACKDVCNYLGLRSISEQYGVYIYVGGGTQIGDYYVQNVVLTISEVIECLDVDIRTFLPKMDIYIDAFQLYSLSLSNEQIFGMNSFNIFFKENEYVDILGDEFKLNFKNINSVSLNPFVLSRSFPKKIILQNLKAGEYRLNITHKNLLIFEKNTSLFLTFSILGLDCRDTIKNLLGLEDISPTNGVFVYMGAGDKTEDGYQKEVFLKLQEDISELYVVLKTFIKDDVLIDSFQIVTEKIGGSEIFEEPLSVDVVEEVIPAAIIESKIQDLPNKDWVLKNLILDKTFKKELKVACILDSFTFNSYKYECDLHQLSIDNWQNDLEAIKPELLFIESAWRGKDEQWYNVVHKNIIELQGIVKWCKDRNIPTIFWNKEDPIHFQTFINTAQQFDHIFTTDIDCLPRYKENLKHSNVYFLPFACQPIVNNPIELYERHNVFCFAGAYYAKYPERTIDLGNIVKALGEYKGVDIYDRNYYKTDSDYRFPEEYQPYIVGTLPFEEIDKAYKGYRYAINLNSIKQSQTMFARRVYELLGSNTLTVSNFSRGVRTLFGDLVFVSDSGIELVKRLEKIVGDEITYHKFRLLGLRKVMFEHTYERRFNFILNKALPDYEIENYLPEISVIAVINNLDDLLIIRGMFEKQTLHSKKLIVIDATSELCLDGNVAFDVYSLNDMKSSKICDISVSPYISLFALDDYYGENYLLDLALATKYSAATVIGKQNVFENNKGNIEEIEVQSYVKANALSIYSSIVARDVIKQMTVIDILENPIFKSEKMLSVDPFNYCKNGQNIQNDKLLLVDDLSIDMGHSLEELLTSCNINALSDNQLMKLDQQSDTLDASKENSSTDIGVIFNEKEIANLFNTEGIEKIKFQYDGQKYLIDSTLHSDEHNYVYSENFLHVDELFKDQNITDFICKSDSTTAIELTLLFLDQDKNRIGHQISQLNVLHTLDIGFVKCKYIQLGWRVKGAVTANIQRLVFYPAEYRMLQKNSQCSMLKGDILTPKNIQEIFSNCSTKTVDISYIDNEYIVRSVLHDEKHEYVYAKNIINLQDIDFVKEIPMYFDVSAGLDIQIVTFFLDETKKRIGHQIDYPRVNTVIQPIENTKFLLFAWRVRGAGSATVKNIYLKHQNFDPKTIFGHSDILVLTNHYPSYQNLYRNAFVHSRVKAYQQAGIAVDVFKFIPKDTTVLYDEFEDIDVLSGSTRLLSSILESGQYKKVLVHFLDANMWKVLERYIDKIEVIVWVHGADIQPWWRRQFNYTNYTEEQMKPIVARSNEKEQFWKSVLTQGYSNLHLVFVSQQFAQQSLSDLGVELNSSQYSIIHNYIDNKAFQYEEKHPEMRKKILSIRPFASTTYANDLTVQAILEVSKEPWFNELSFTIIGDGILFDEITAPLKEFKNVRLEKRFLNQQEIIQEHKKHGVFLVPTRMDTQGVSRGEAMSSGLVAITNSVAAIPEFCSDEDTMLVETEDYRGLADCINQLYHDQSLYKKLSYDASQRTLQQCGFINTIESEIMLIKGIV